MLTQPLTHQPQSPHGRFEELDALRGIAALSVVIFHFTINDNGKVLGWNFSYGVTGVDLFFMISGFVIFLTIRKVKKWPDFVVGRFARLYPAFWYCMLVTALFFVLFDPQPLDISRILANATMVAAFFGIENLDGSYWTLPIELIFYLWILTLFISNKIGDIELIGFITTVVILAFHQLSPHYPGFYDFTTRKIQLLNHFPLFFSGILFYQLKDQKTPARNIVLLLFSMLAACYLHNRGGMSQHHVSATAHYLIIGLFHLIFAFFITGKLAFLRIRPLLFLGKISYCLYLLHQYIGLKLISVFNQNLGINIYLSIAIVILICIGLAFLATRFIEIPANQLIKNWYKNYISGMFRSGGKEVAL